MFSCGNTLCERHITDKKEIRATIGQELIDLKSALDSGAISEEEYEILKEKIMNRGRKRDDKRKRK